MNRARTRLCASVTALVLIVAACGDDDSSSDTTAASDAAAAETTAAPESTDGAETTAAPDTAEPEGCDASGTLSWWTAWTLEQADAYVAEFNKVCPDVNVEVTRSDDAAQVDRFNTEVETNNVSVDVITVGWDGYAKQWAADGSLLSYESPEASVYPETAIGADHMYYVNAKLLTGICVNTDVLASEGLDEPAGWEALTDPQYKDQMVMQDMRVEGSGAWALTINLKYYWNDDARWEAFFEGLAANNVTFQPDYTSAQQQLVQGNFAVMPVCYPDYIQPAIDDGAPVKWLAAEPVIEVFFAWVIVKDGPNNAAGQAFTDFMLSEAGQTAISEIIGQVPARPGVDYPATAAAAEGLDTFPALGTPETAEQYECCKADYTAQIEEWFGA